MESEMKQPLFYHYIHTYSYRYNIAAECKIKLSPDSGVTWLELTMAPLKASAVGNNEVFINEASALVVVAAVHEASSLHHSQHCMLKALSSVSITYSSVALKKQSCSCLHFANYSDLKAA